MVVAARAAEAPPPRQQQFPPAQPSQQIPDKETVPAPPARSAITFDGLPPSGDAAHARSRKAAPPRAFRAARSRPTPRRACARTCARRSRAVSWSWPIRSCSSPASRPRSRNPKRRQRAPIQAPTRSDPPGNRSAGRGSATTTAAACRQRRPSTPARPGTPRLRQDRAPNRATADPLAPARRPSRHRRCDQADLGTAISPSAASCPRSS